MFALRSRAGLAAATSAIGHLKTSSTVVNRRCVILLLQEHSWSEGHRWQSSAATTTSSAAAAQAALHAPSFISRKNVGTSSSRNVEVTLTTSSSFGGTPSTAKTPRPPLPPNMVFRPASHSTLAALEHLEVVPTSTAHEMPLAATTATRPLCILFAWMLSKNTHIEKYRHFWTSRGYDILTVQTPPLALLLPGIGGRQIAHNVFDFLATINPRYDEVIIHAFSVGGYQLCEFLYRMSTRIAAGDAEAERMYKSLKGLVIDSCVFADDCPPGLSRAITHHPIAQPAIEKAIAGFLNATRKFTLERYYKVEKHLFRNEMKIPGLLLISRDDVVSNVQTNFQLAEGWRKANIPAAVKCWDKSVHVLHYREHPQAYEFEVDRFLYGLETIKKAPKREPVVPENGDA